MGEWPLEQVDSKSLPLSLLGGWGGGGGALTTDRPQMLRETKKFNNNETFSFFKLKGITLLQNG